MGEPEPYHERPERITEIVSALQGSGFEDFSNLRTENNHQGGSGFRLWGNFRHPGDATFIHVDPTASYIQFFPVLQHQRGAASPLGSTENEGSWDVYCNVSGGGITGQSEAVRLGLARALKAHNIALDPVLRESGHLTRDSRMKERKKPGRRGARRGFQFSKR